MNKREKIAMVAGVIVVSLIISGVSIHRAKRYADYTEDTVIVSKANGTLWDIAKEHCPEDMDIRTYIHFIKEDNNCTSNIRNGQVLTIRKYK